MFDPVAYINEPRWRSSRLGLGRMRELLERLGRPQDRLKFVHVAGTNGKGSTCAFLASILQEAGYRTGLFTSPFIEAFEERIRVDGANISSGDLADVTLSVREQAEAMADHPTEFELMCAVALVHFARRACDIVVMEVGLGGRLDATNVIDAPEVCVIARIGLDHTDLLGSTLAQIAGEKAGIVKRGASVVSYPQEPGAMEVVSRAAKAVGAPLSVPDFSRLGVVPLDLASAGAAQWVANGRGCKAEAGAGEGAAGRYAGTGAAGHDAGGEGRNEGEGGRSVASALREFSYGEFYGLRTKLLGSYQPQNAALAIEAVRALRARGWAIPDKAVREGIASAAWPGRFEVVATRPLLVVDGGHNPQGAQALADTLSDVLPGRRVVFVMGVLADKDYPAMVEEVLPFARAFVAMAPPNPRALSAGDLADAIEKVLPPESEVLVVPAEDTAGAVARAREMAGPQGVVVAFGSLYSIAVLKAAIAGLGNSD